MIRTTALRLGMLLIVLILGCASCGKQERAASPNLILIVIDTLRPDHLPCYGYPENTAPFLTRLAARGVVCERVHSTSSWTAPATASLLTSLHPVQHGVLKGFLAVQALREIVPEVQLDRVPAEVTTLAEMLQDAGYATWAVTDNINISREQGFDQGFDRFWNFNYQGAEAVNAPLTERIDKLRASEPFFLYLHYMDPHRPYHRQAPWYRHQEGELLDSIAAYDSEIHYVDQKIGELLQLLGWEQNSVIVVTSDHGEEFLEHGGWDHGRSLYAEVLDVPLIFYSAQDSLAGRRITQRVSILDIVPTLRDFADLPPDTLLQGASLRPLMMLQEHLPAERPHFADLRSPPWFGNRTLKACIQDDMKFIWTLPDTVELYHLGRDPEELVSLAQEADSRSLEFQRQIEVFEASCQKFTPEAVEIKLDPADVQKLRSLGYIK
jgi:arylsulfatase A-like enzyme